MMAGKSRIKLPVLNPGWVEYLRTSDEDAQAPERSQGYQHRLNMDNLISPSGMKLLETYADTFSGKRVDRHNYQRLLTDARLGKFSHVAIAFADRFGRSDVEGLRAYDELQSLGIKVRIATYPSLEPEKSDARMIVGILFNVAQFEVMRTGERSREAMIETLQRGDWAFKAPDGYLNTEVKKKDVDPSERGRHSRHKHAVALDQDRAHIWREAWELLLTNQLTLAAICEVLHGRGYRLASGKPFVEVNKFGTRVTAAKNLSVIFHNWFYAGWVVIDNRWLSIPPKQVRGNWEPICSTEAFERGLEILDKRMENRRHQTRRQYLLQRMIFLQDGQGRVRKLTCSTSNANRDRGGVAYYCVASTNLNFLCHKIDDQVARWIRHIHVDEDCLPLIREAYRSDIERYLSSPTDGDRHQLQKALKNIDEAELFFARQYASQTFSEENWQRMAREWRDQRVHILAQLQAIDALKTAQLANLDDAISLIANAGILFSGLPPEGQRQLLQLMVEKVVIDLEGQILHVELQAPFAYLNRLVAHTTVPSADEADSHGNLRAQNKTSRGQSAGSISGNFGAPKHIGNEPLFGPVLDDLFLFAELTAYPQRSALEQALTLD